MPLAIDLGRTDRTLARVLSVMRLAVLFLISLLGAGCGGAEVTPAPAEAPIGEEAATLEARGAEPGRIDWRDEERGFTVSYPETWQRAPSPLTPNLSDPLELLALGTYELRPGGDRCSHQPVNAIEDLGPSDALIVIFERAPPYAEGGYPPRQGPPELAGGTGRFCVPGTNRLDGWFSFGENGRAFYALIALGENASEKTRAQLFTTYESIAIDEN